MKLTYSSVEDMTYADMSEEEWICHVKVCKVCKEYDLTDEDMINEVKCVKGKIILDTWMYFVTKD